MWPIRLWNTSKYLAAMLLSCVYPGPHRDRIFWYPHPFYPEVKVQKRGASYHRGRLGEALREEIETLVEGELADPRIGLVSVTGVHLADDGRSAQVWVDVDGDEKEAERCLVGLDAAKAYIRHEVAERLRLRRAPELHFRIDRAEREKARVEELLTRAKKKKKTQGLSSETEASEEKKI